MHERVFTITPPHTKKKGSMSYALPSKGIKDWEIISFLILVLQLLIVKLVKPKFISNLVLRGTLYQLWELLKPIHDHWISETQIYKELVIERNVILIIGITKRWYIVNRGISETKIHKEFGIERKVIHIVEIYETKYIVNHGTRKPKFINNLVSRRNIIYIVGITETK